MSNFKTAEDYLRNKYGAYRGSFSWRDEEKAFNAGLESQASVIAQLEAELAAAKLSRLDKENLEIGRQLQRAANDLPDLFNIEIDVENGCAGVTLINEDGNRRSFILDEHLSDTISEAIDAAIVPKEQQ